MTMTLLGTLRSKGDGKDASVGQSCHASMQTRRGSSDGCVCADTEGWGLSISADMYGGEKGPGR